MLFVHSQLALVLPAFRTAWSTANSWASPVPTAPCSKHPRILHFGDQMQQEIKLRECQKRRQELSRSDNWPSAPPEDNKLFPSPGGQPHTHSLPLEEDTWLGMLEKCSFILSPGRQSKGTLLTHGSSSRTRQTTLHTRQSGGFRHYRAAVDLNCWPQGEAQVSKFCFPPVRLRSRYTRQGSLLPGVSTSLPYI